MYNINRLTNQNQNQNKKPQGVEMDLAQASKQQLVAEVLGLKKQVHKLESILSAINFPEVLIEYWDDTICSLLAIMNIMDPTTAKHQKCVSALAYEIGLAMNLPKEKIMGLQMAGLTHDIGKISVPTRFLQKPESLNAHEFNCVIQHTVAGHEILQSIKWPWPVAKVALEHHEKQDGSGYPQKLSGDQSCVESRIIAVADVVHAMCSRRPYRDALTLEQALDEVTSQSGVRFYEPAVRACMHAFKKNGFCFGKLSSHIQ